MQKLMFLLFQRSQTARLACPEPYQFVPYDYGPYSDDLNRDLRDYSDPTWGDPRQAEAIAKDPEDLSFDYLTSFQKKSGKAEAYILKGPRVAEAVEALTRLGKDGINTSQLLMDFRELHYRFGRMTLEDLLRFVYSEYREMAANTKRPDLLSALDEQEWDMEEADSDDNESNP